MNMATNEIKNKGPDYLISDIMKKPFCMAWVGEYTHGKWRFDSGWSFTQNDRFDKSKSKQPKFDLSDVMDNECWDHEAKTLADVRDQVSQKTYTELEQVRVDINIELDRYRCM